MICIHLVFDFYRILPDVLPYRIAPLLSVLRFFIVLKFDFFELGSGELTTLAQVVSFKLGTLIVRGLCFSPKDLSTFLVAHLIYSSYYSL